MYGECTAGLAISKGYKNTKNVSLFIHCGVVDMSTQTITGESLLIEFNARGPGEIFLGQRMIPL